MSKQVKPITLKKQVILNRQFALNSNLLKSYKVVKPITHKEDIIYTSKPCDLFSGEFRSLQIVNKLHLATNTCRTIASCVDLNGEVFEKNSDEITALIGQNNYDMLFTSLCSILSQELKLRGIWALLTRPRKKVNSIIQTEVENKILKLVNICTQTDSVALSKIEKKSRRRNKVSPYVLSNKPEIKKVIVDPQCFSGILNKSPSTPEKITLPEKPQGKPEPSKPEPEESSLPELGTVFDDECDRLSSITVSSFPDIYTDPIKIIDQHTKDLKEENMADTEIYNMNLQSQFYPMKEVNKNPGLNREKLKKMIKDGLEALKNCLETDADGYMRIHFAISTNDVELLNMQCLALRRRGTSVDVMVDGQTPLKMALYQDNPELVSILLHHGADILDSDEEGQTPVHIAATLDTEHLEVIINYCRQNARRILQDSEECWKPEYEHKSDIELCDCLLQHISKLSDRQGFTPLMLASQLGKYNNVIILSECCRNSIDHRATSSGNTALFEAVRAACMDCIERGNKSKVVDHHYETIRILLENGADPDIENFSGSTVNDVLSEYNIPDLSLLVANTISNVRCKPLGHMTPKGPMTPMTPTSHLTPIAPNKASKSSLNIMLYKEQNGTVKLKEINKKSKPKILANIPVKITQVISNKINNDTKNKDGQNNVPKNNGNNKSGVILETEIKSSKNIELKSIAVNKPLILKKAVKRKSDNNTNFKAPVTKKANNT